MVWEEITAGDDAVDEPGRKRFFQALKNRDEALRTNPFFHFIGETSTVSTSFVEIVVSRLYMFVPDWVETVDFDVLLKIAGGSTNTMEVRIADPDTLAETTTANVTSVSATYERKNLSITPTAGEKGKIRLFRFYHKTSSGANAAFVKSDSFFHMGNKFSG